MLLLQIVLFCSETLLMACCVYAINSLGTKTASAQLQNLYEDLLSQACTSQKQGFERLGPQRISLRRVQAAPYTPRISTQVACILTLPVAVCSLEVVFLARIPSVQSMFQRASNV